MTRGARARLGAVALGALAFGAIVALPRPAGRTRLPAPAQLRLSATPEPGAAPFDAAVPAPPERTAAAEPQETDWVGRVDAQLALRMPRLRSPDRLRIAQTLVTEADAARIDPLLVLALIQIESSFDPAALSNRGARGLMQLREPTFRREVERAGLDWEEAHHPAVNVQAGIRYLRRLLDAFGAEEIALMAYNAGPNRILSYMRKGEIPERFHAYPRKVKAEMRRLRRSFAQDRRPESAERRRPGPGPQRPPVLAASRTPTLPE